MELPQIIIYGRGDKVPDDYIKINTTSISKEDWSKKFSPFLLGPIEVRPLEDSKVSLNFENAWQYSKRYMNQSKEEWNQWSDDGFENNKAVRFPMGRGSKPMYAYYHGKELGYIKARFKIYAPLYEKCIKRYAKEPFKKLKKMIKEGKKIALFDFDGYCHFLKGMTLEDVIYNSRKKMGHSFVLLGMLTKNKFWKEKYNKKKEKIISVPRLK